MLEEIRWTIGDGLYGKSLEKKRSVCGPEPIVLLSDMVMIGCCIEYWLRFYAGVISSLHSSCRGSCWLMIDDAGEKVDLPLVSAVTRPRPI